MGYIEKSLMDGEQIVYQPQLHSVIYWRPALLAVLGILILVVPTEGKLLYIQLALSTLLIFLSILGGIKAHGGRQYVLTNKRLIAKKGIIERNSLELMLRKCEGVQIKQSFIGRIFDFGTILVTTGEATNKFDHIKDPIVFSTRINQMIDNLKPSDS